MAGTAADLLFGCPVLAQLARDSSIGLSRNEDCGGFIPPFLCSPLPSPFHLYKEQERILKDHIYPISCSAGLEDLEVKGKCLYYLVVPRCGRNSNL